MTTETYATEPTSSEYRIPITAELMLNTLDHTLIPGVYSYSTLQDVKNDLANPKSPKLGIWLIRADDMRNVDEHGFVCIHWPTYISRICWWNETARRLKAKGVSLNAVQKKSLRELQGAVTSINGYKAALLRTLPPGSLLEAPSDLFTELVYCHLLPEHVKRWENEHLSASMGPWTIFRLGSLAKKTDHAFRTTVNRYCAVNESFISKASLFDTEHPALIRTLLRCMFYARQVPGKGWQRYGLAWVKEGLVFNYKIALTSLFDHHHEAYTAIFPNQSQNPAGDWLDPAYALQTPVMGFPRLSEITQNNAEASAYMSAATAPYKILFEDQDRDVLNAAYSHNTDFRIFFPIKYTGNKPNILTYIRDIAMSDIPDVKPLPSFSKAKQVAPPPEKRPVGRPTKELEHNIYVAGFSGYMLNNTAPEGAAFSQGMVEYRGEYYFSIPDFLNARFPELSFPQFYDRSIKHVVLQWVDEPDKGFVPRIMDQRYFASEARKGEFVELSMAHSTIKLPLTRTIKGITFLHPSVYRPDGEVFQLIHAITDGHPALAETDKELFDVLRTFWAWIYDAPTQHKQGRVTDEFAFPCGYDTKFCPPEQALTNPAMRIQFIADKALHSNDPRVCDLPRTEDRNAARSKALNSYDNFVLWYVAHHEIAELPWKLSLEDQSRYITKRWLPWRRSHSLKEKDLVKPHKEGANKLPMLEPRPIDPKYPMGPKTKKESDISIALKYADKTFGRAYTAY